MGSLGGVFALVMDFREVMLTSPLIFVFLLLMFYCRNCNTLASIETIIVRNIGLL